MYGGFPRNMLAHTGIAEARKMSGSSIRPHLGGSAVGERAKGVAQSVPPTWTERSETDAESGFRHNSEIVEGRDAVVIHSFVGPDGNTRWDRANHAGDRRHNNVVQDGNGLVARDDEHRPPLAVRWFHLPQIALGYHGSALAMARASSSDELRVMTVGVGDRFADPGPSYGVIEMFDCPSNDLRPIIADSLRHESVGHC